MTITLGLTVFGWKPITLDMRMDLDQPTAQAADSLITRGVKKTTRWWSPRMSS